VDEPYRPRPHDHLVEPLIAGLDVKVGAPGRGGLRRSTILAGLLAGATLVIALWLLVR
jgi:hypothetical protein